MYIKYKYYECGFNGEVYSNTRKVKCSDCDAENDFWLDGEEPPENHR